MSFDEQLQPVLDVAAEHAVSVDRDGRFPEEAIGTLRASGLLGLTLPVSIGGLDGSPADFLVGRAVARVAVRLDRDDLPDARLRRAGHAGRNAGGGCRRRCARWPTDRTCRPSPSANGARAAISGRRSASSPGRRLSAQKSFVTAAGHADSYVVSTRPERARLADRVEPLPGARLGCRASRPAPAWDGLGLRGNASAPMTFDVDVDDSMLLGEAGKGLDLMLGVVLPWFQLGSGRGLARHRGGARCRRRRRARDRARSSSISGRRWPTCRRSAPRIGRAQTEIDTVAGFLADVARRMGEGDPQVPILSAKASANEMAIRVTSEAMQACGGAAMSTALPIERSFRDARAGSVMAPTTDVLYELTGRALAGMPLL